MKRILLFLFLLPLAAEIYAQSEEGLVIGRPTTITDVSPYQGCDVGFTGGGYYDEETFDYIYSMGSITLDAPASPQWQIGRFALPINYFENFDNYDPQTGEEASRIYKIGTFLNLRTPVEAREVTISLNDPGNEEWLFFSVPFDVNVDDIRGGLGQWVIRRYSGENRAAVRAGETWVDVRPGEMLHAGEGYVFMRNYNGLQEDTSINWDEYEETEEDYCLVLPAAPTENKQNLFACKDVVLPLKHYAAERPTNADWNLLGNPYPCYYDLSAIPEKAVIYVWDYDRQIYQTLNTGEHNDAMLAPGQPFFVQAGELEQLTFPASGRRVEGRFDFPDDEDWGDDEWDEDYSAKGESLAARVRQMGREAVSNALAQRKARRQGPGTTFNPESPYDPGANYFNLLTGEAVFDLTPQGILMAAIHLFGSETNANLVKSLTVLGNPGPYMILSLFTQCERVDLGRAEGLTTVPARAFSYMMNLREVILPSSVTAIDDQAFKYCIALEQIDILATTPPALTEAVFTNMMNNRAEMVIRVPAGAVEAYRQADVWKTLNILPLDGGGEELQGVSLQVKAPDGRDLTGECSILWTDEEGNVLGTGSTLLAQSVGTTVSYSIGLLPSIASLYVPVPQRYHTVQASGNVITVTLEPTGVADLGSKQLTSTRGMLDITFLPSDDEAPSVFNPNDILLSIRDKATGRAFTDLVLQYPGVAFEQTRLQSGQVIQLNLASRSGAFQTVQAEARVQWDETFTAHFDVKEWGLATINCAPDEGVDQMMALVFDGDGRFVARFNAEGNVVRVSALPDGSYQAVLMQQNPYLNAVASLSDLQQSILRQDTDYTLIPIELQSGTVGRFEGAVHPLDMSRLGHISSESYLTTNDAELSITSAATLKAKVLFKDEYAGQVSNVQLIIDIPQGMNYVQKSLISTAGTHQLAGQRLIVPCSPGEQVKWCLASTESGQRTVSAMVQYVLGGQQYLQPLGAATILVRGLTLDVVSTTNTPQVNVRGFAFGGSQVTLYDGRAVVGQTIARSDGSFDADITLNPAYDGTLHHIYADIETAGQPRLTTENSTVLYDKNASVLTRVALIYQDQRVTWNCLTGAITPGYYNVVPDLSTVATFMARFENPKPECILDPYFEVTASDGTRRTFDATWDQASQIYTATGDYPDIFCTPAEVQFLFTYADSTAYSRPELFDAEVNALVAAHNELVEGIEKSMKVGDIIANEDDHFAVTFGIEHDCQFLLTMQLEDYDQVMKMQAEQNRPLIRTIMEGDTVASFFTSPDEYCTTLFFANQSKHTAYSEAIQTLASPTARPRRVSWGGIVGGIKDFFSPTPSNLLNINGMINAANGKVESANKALEALNYIDEMQARYDEYNNNLSTRINLLQYLLLARCPNGELRVPANLYGSFQEQIRQLDDSRKVFTKQMQSLILSYCNALENAGYKEIAKELAKFTAKFLAKNKLSVKSGQLANNMSQTGLGTAEEFSGLLNDGINNGIDVIVDKTADLITQHGHISTDFAGVRQLFEKFTPEEYHKISMRVTDLKFTIQAAYKKCEVQELVRPPVPWAKRKRRVRPAIDPSGYVYEGVEGNRLEGVTATIYYKESEQGTEQLWDAEEFGQVNPQVTDAAGLYMWNVPQGLWQVRFQKEGYETAQTEWLPVPPPQLEIAVPMVQHTAPQVTDAQARTSGVSICFSKPMQTASLSGLGISQDGTPLRGTLEFPDEQDGLACRLRFVPDGPITASRVEVNVPAEACSYAGDEIGSPYSRELPVLDAIQGFVVQQDAVVQVGSVGYVTVSAYPAPAVAGQTLRLSFRSPLIEQVPDPLVFDAEGQVLVPLRGLLPGRADVTFGIGDLQVRAAVEVKTHLFDVVARPIPCIPDGTVVGEGSCLELYSATPGAQIYYTTDGSCPCDPEHRLLYTGPIPITGEMTIQAVAVCEGMTDSEVITLRYSVGDGLPVQKTLPEGILLRDEFYDMAGRPVLPPLRPGLYLHVRRTTEGIRSSKMLVK